MASNTGFGFNNAAQNPAAGSSGFGGSSFGAASSTPAFGQSTTGFGGSAFGGTAATPAFGQSTTGFGGAATTPAFGQSSTGFGGSATTPAFGQSSTGFGGATTSSSFGQPSTGFGGGTSTPAFGQSSTGFGGAATSSAFGQSSTGFGEAATSSAFGQSSAGFGGVSSTSAFGGASSSTGFGQSASGFGGNSFGAASTASGFGSTSAGFGGTSAPAFGATSSGFGSSAFGANAAKPAFGAATGFGGAASTSAFGQNNSTSAFGANTATGSAFGFGQPKVTAAPLGSSFGTGNTQTNPGVNQGTGTISGFGAVNQNANTIGGLGAASGSQISAFDTLTIQMALEKIGLAKNVGTEASVLEQCIGIQQSLDAKSENYLFQSFFYNLIHPSQANTFAEPSNNPNYQNAKKENPDPRCMVPVLAVGPDGLKERSKAQRTQIALHRAALAKINEKLQAVAKTQTLALRSRLGKIQDRQEGMKYRISHLNQLALVMAQKGAPLRPEEEELHRQLKEMQEKIISPEAFETLQKGVLSQLQKHKDRFAESSQSIPAPTKPETRAALKETIESNTRALEALKIQLAGDIQLTKYLRSKSSAA